MADGPARLTPAELAALLDPGERMIWHGGPRGFHTPFSVWFSRLLAIVILLPMSVVFIVMGHSVTQRTGDFDPLLPFGIILLYALAAVIVLPVIRYHIRLRNTDYLLTDRRAIVMAKQTESFPIAPDMVLEHQPARLWRSGSVFFATRVASFRINEMYVRLKIGFSRIADAASVVDEIRALQRHMTLTRTSPASYDLPPPPAPEPARPMQEIRDPGDLTARVQALLQPGETLLWQGRPQGLFRPDGLRDTSLFLFGVLLVIGVGLTSLGPGLWPMSRLTSALLTIVGVTLICGSLMTAAIIRKRRRLRLRRSLYGLTDRRAIVIDDQNRSYPITPETRIAYHAPWRRRAASVFFAAETAPYQINHQPVTLLLGFSQIPEAEAVVQMIRDLQARMRRQPEVRYA